MLAQIGWYRHDRSGLSDIVLTFQSCSSIRLVTRGSDTEKVPSRFSRTMTFTRHVRGFLVDVMCKFQVPSLIRKPTERVPPSRPGVTRYKSAVDRRRRRRAAHGGSVERWLKMLSRGHSPATGLELVVWETRRGGGCGTLAQGALARPQPCYRA